MDIDLDLELIQRVLSAEQALAAREIATLGPVTALERSHARHDERLAAAPDAGSLACRAGCSWCCYFTVDVRAVEVFGILDFARRALTAEQTARFQAEVRANRALLSELDEEARVTRNMKCPFLEAGRCLIYAARPQYCRNYHATDAAGCQKSFEEPGNLDIDPEFAPGVYQIGNAHVEAFANALKGAGLDSRVYELNCAFEAALADPGARSRFEAGSQPFPGLEGAEVPQEFDDLAVEDPPGAGAGAGDDRASGSGPARDLHIYRRAFQLAPQPMAILDSKGASLGLNHAFVRELGYTISEAPTLDDYVKKAFPDSDYGRRTVERWQEHGKQFLESHIPQQPIVATHVCRDGVSRTFEVRTTWTPTETFVTFLDVTERTRAEERLRLWNSVMQSTSEGIIVCDAQSRIIAVNPAFERMTGYTEAEAVGRTPRFLHSGRQDPEFYAQMWKSIEATGNWSGELWNRRKDGGLYAQWLALNAVHDQDGRLTHYVGVVSDITDFKAQQERLHHLALFDLLTELPNRANLQQRLDHAVALARRQNAGFALFFLDLDRFKEINDSLGHDAGDALLRTVAARIRSMVRESDTVARIGGDEFVIVMENLFRAEDAARVARDLLARIGLPMTLDGREVTVSASIGISRFPMDGATSGELMRNADSAMYVSKREGRDRYTFFSDPSQGSPA